MAPEWTSQPAPAVVRRTRWRAMRPRGARAAWGRAMRVVRRIHLYSGLLLVPFVVLYGVTAFLFNHPAVWSSASEERVQDAELAAAGRLPLGPPEVLAARVVADLGDPAWQLDEQQPARFRGRAVFAAQASGTEHSLVLDQPDGPGRLVRRASTGDENRKQRLTRGRSLETGKNALETARAAAEAVLADRGVGGAPVRMRSVPRLEFGLLKGGEPHVATYDLAKGSLEVEPALESRAALSLRGFLLRLHTAHGYPSRPGALFWWAILVDVMAATMVSWAVTGLLMWWQMRALRIAGTVTLALCALATTALVSGMWHALR
jgi:hypothetical protein